MTARWDKESDLVRIGFGHASLINALRPDVAYPTRKVRGAKSVVSTIAAQPCTCPEEHVEVWVRRAT